MSRRVLFGFLFVLIASTTNAAVETLADPGVGVHPQLPQPVHSLLPTVNIAPAMGWPKGVVPIAAAGLTVRPFAAGLEHPRWLYSARSSC